MGAEVAAPSIAPAPDLSKYTVIKSPSDDRSYELVHLSNGLCALLIHDPKISNDEDEDEDMDEDEDGDGEEEDDDDDEYEDVNDCPDCLENGSCAAHNDNDSDDGSRRSHYPGTTKKMVQFSSFYYTFLT